jgi:hypothetical protein
MFTTAPTIYRRDELTRADDAPLNPCPQCVDRRATMARIRW